MTPSERGDAAVHVPAPIGFVVVEEPKLCATLTNAIEMSFPGLLLLQLCSLPAPQCEAEAFNSSRPLNVPGGEATNKQRG